MSAGVLRIAAAAALLAIAVAGNAATGTKDDVAAGGGRPSAEWETIALRQTVDDPLSSGARSIPGRTAHPYVDGLGYGSTKSDPRASTDPAPDSWVLVVAGVVVVGLMALRRFDTEDFTDD